MISFEPSRSVAPEWTPERRAPRASDQALTGTTRRWLRNLPARRRPLRLCQLYPRVANRLAWAWPDGALCNQVLDDLLIDRRGGRDGFPRSVQRELLRLQDFRGNERAQHAERGEPGGSGLWGRLGRGWVWP